MNSIITSILNKILDKILKRPPPVYGLRIFTSRSWLERQVDEELYKKAYGLDR